MVIFQNSDDRDVMIRHGFLGRPDKAVIIRGSGVDGAQFPFSEEPLGQPLVVFPSRMLKHKGIEEFIRAAKYLKNKGLSARFALVGEVDQGNPSSLSAAEIHLRVQEGIVEWWGYREDMPNVLKAAHIVCLPSYREGVPKSLIEALAVGRPIVTTNVPGCREVVEDQVNGLLVPARSVEELAHALEALIKDADLRRRMGRIARQTFEAEFTLTRVLDQTFAVYESLLRRRCLSETVSGLSVDSSCSES
jgi:glycosyltransferase involved in cell wall biosynthesis